MKKILMLTNMYPSKKYPHYGSFVKNTEDILNGSGYKVITIKMHKHNNRILKLFSYMRFFISYFFHAFKKYDYIYIHYISHSSIPVVKLNRLFKKSNIILNVHGNDIVPDRKEDYKNIIRSRKALKIASKVIAPSIYFKEVLVGDYNVDPNKVFIFPSGGVDNKYFGQDISLEEAKKKVGLSLDRKYIGMVSRIEKDKGYDNLVKAFNDIYKDYPDYDLLIIGSGDEESNLNSLIEKYKLNSRIYRVPLVCQNELLYYYKAMDLFVLPTKRKSESLSLVGLEAFSSGTLSVISTLYGPKEYANNDNSVTYSSKSYSDLTDALKKALKLNKKIKDKLISNAKKDALKYDKTKMSDILKNIFN